MLFILTTCTLINFSLNPKVKWMFEKDVKSKQFLFILNWKFFIKSENSTDPNKDQPSLQGSPLPYLLEEVRAWKVPGPGGPGWGGAEAAPLPGGQAGLGEEGVGPRGCGGHRAFLWGAGGWCWVSYPALWCTDM